MFTPYQQQADRSPPLGSSRQCFYVTTCLHVICCVLGAHNMAMNRRYWLFWVRLQSLRFSSPPTLKNLSTYAQRGMGKGWVLVSRFHFYCTNGLSISCKGGLTLPHLP
ncbi:unnamed protein product, partial [Choristocarpus tenellus]